MYRDTDSGRLVLSPTDLVNFTSCVHLTHLSLLVSEDALTKPELEDADLELIRRLGDEHERAYLHTLLDQGIEVVVIPGDGDLMERVAATDAALAVGPDYIYQASFFDQPPGPLAWRGHADFLRKVEDGRRPGGFSYEPEDTKLARHVKPTAVLQLCDYAAHLERLLGVEAARIHVILGTNETVSLALHDFAAYYRMTRHRFEVAVAARADTYPDPVSHCAICAWRTDCDARRLADDHLSLVAGMRSDQIRKLQAAGVATMADLARLEESIPTMAADTLAKLHQQARLQVLARSQPDRPAPYELLEDSGEHRGLAALPPPSAGDLFFDIEGDPHYDNVGLEYLLGLGWVGADGAFQYKAFWGTDRDGERAAFEELIDFIGARLADDPDLHVYHYAPYEPNAFGRLMGRHDTRKEEVDALFRANVLVDLLQVVRQSVRIGLPSYGLKKVESLYMQSRSESITDGGSSIVEFERWRDEQDQQILDDLEAYNAVDCYSTQLLRDWLESLRSEYAAQFGAAPGRPHQQMGDPPAHVRDEAIEVAALVAGLHALHPATPADAAATLLLGQLLEWHRDEDKPEYWRFYHRVLQADEEELFNDTEAVTGLEYVGPLRTEAKSIIHRYRFDAAQEHKLSRGNWCDPESERSRIIEDVKIPGPGSIVDYDTIAGTVDLKRGTNSMAPHPRSLIPSGPVNTDAHRAALRRLATSVIDGGVDSSGPYRAARDLLLRRPPRLGGGVTSSGLLRRDDETAEQAASRLAGALDGGVLAIQGPPGSGKTSTAARLIVDLVGAGKRVGLTANSHSVISNLLDAVAACARERRTVVAMAQKTDGDHGSDDAMVTRYSTNPEMLAALDTHQVLAGTGWLFSRPEFDQRLDVMIVDEAGQLSLANTLAIATAASNLVLVGDPNQLAQPSKGTHPVGVNESALSHLLGGHLTMPGELGLFLEHTHRLHPDICRFTSEVFYDGRLTSLEGCERQAISGSDDLAGSGLRWLPIAHEGNRTASMEEAEGVADLVERLVGREWTDRQGRNHRLGPEDILVVAPYNAQVSLIADVLGLERPAAVGTVDRFQGREAPVVIVSLATSTPEQAPRGLEFLYSRNRMNVAVSRAQALTILVGAPALLSAQCHNVEQMRLVNGLCRYVELSSTLELTATS